MWRVSFSGIRSPLPASTSVAARMLFSSSSAMSGSLSIRLSFLSFVMSFPAAMSGRSHHFTALGFVFAPLTISVVMRSQRAAAIRPMMPPSEKP